ncbi:AP-5 complex subunit zeta-1-like isoform X2 [Ornithodoros turicata]|uniref:AP-5 complex subunit zeta-1-like isoform X2 n=1 Tax=Ornithodoros turicata TaxID=34597 RepID=UPI003138B091
MAAPSFAEDLISVRSRKRPSLNELFENLPKQLTKDVLQNLQRALFECDPELIPQNEEVVSSLLGVILDEKTGLYERHLSLAVLKSLSPQYGLEEMLLPLPPDQIVIFLQPLLVQGTGSRYYREIFEKLLRALEDNDTSYDTKCHILLYLTQVTEANESLLTTEDAQAVLSQFPGWLLDCSAFSAKKMATSLLSASQQQAPSRFRRSETPQPVYELDGTVSQKMFTVLSCAKYNTPDQTLNIATFSVLRHWTAAALHHKFADERFVSAVRQYCLYVIGQSQKKPTQPEDSESERASLVEALHVLDTLCLLENSTLQEVMPTIQRLVDSLYPSSVAVDTALLQFLLHHGGMDQGRLDDMIAKFLEEVVAESFRDDADAVQVTTFVQENLAQLCYDCGGVLEKYFPALFKVFAWHPRHFTAAFSEILPAVMSSKTSVEVFYCLVDLPCTVATMLVDSKDPSVPESVHARIVADTHAPMVKFVLRNTSGIGDTFAGAARFHGVISGLSSHPRVVQCSTHVLSLLTCFFSTFLEYADAELASRLVPPMLERLTISYGSTNYAEKLRKALADVVPPLFKKFPEITFLLTNELVDYLSHTVNRNAAPEFFANLVWAIGEFASPSETPLFNPSAVADYFEVLECVTFELLGSASMIQQLRPSRLLCVLITSLAKLAVRSQDLLPRAMLCLAKSGQACGDSQSQHHLILAQRVRELSTLLQTSGAASAILSPPTEDELERQEEATGFVACAPRKV